MTGKPSSSSPRLLSLLGQAAVKAGKDNDDSRMKAAGERAHRLAAKAIREGKAGKVIDGNTVVIVEK